VSSCRPNLRKLVTERIPLSSEVSWADNRSQTIARFRHRMTQKGRSVLRQCY